LKHDFSGQTITKAWSFASALIHFHLCSPSTNLLQVPQCDARIPLFFGYANRKWRAISKLLKPFSLISLALRPRSMSVVHKMHNGILGSTRLILFT
jgi:hypothetical protein